MTSLKKFSLKIRILSLCFFFNMDDNLSSSKSEFLEDSDNDCNESLVEDFVECFCGLEPYNFEPEAKTKQKQIRKSSTVECSDVTDTPSRVGHRRGQYHIKAFFTQGTIYLT